MIDSIIIIGSGNLILGVLFYVIYKKYRENRKIFKENNAYYQRPKKSRTSESEL